ncbi:O-methyltransferase [Pseudonocardia sp.]|uniref:O-methyltransferase n=1 Tax=Pseudonocardia sp. TaxID=60912 RepID=UPI003D0EAB61
MNDDSWIETDAFLTDLFVGEDVALDAALATNAEAGLPPIDVSPPQGRLLHLLARAVGARRILEIGTLGGYSTIWLARALPADGRLVTCEVDPHHADVARANLERAGLGGRVDVVVGPALETVAALDGPFDLVFADADKPSNAEYFARAVELTRPGGLIVVDNVVRHGTVVAGEDPNAVGSRRALAAMAADPRVVATAIQTVGSKGHDGFAIALRL